MNKIEEIVCVLCEEILFLKEKSELIEDVRNEQRGILQAGQEKVGEKKTTKPVMCCAVQ